MIGVVTTSYPRHAQDWAGAFVRERVRALVDGGACVEVLAAADATAAGETPEPRVEVFRIPSSRALFYGAGAPEALEAGGLALIGAAGAFAARLASAVGDRVRRWSAVESHWLVPSALVVCATRSRIPHRAFAHGGDVAWLERVPGGAALARWITRRGPQLIFASADLRARFARLTGLDPQELAAQVEAAPFDRRTFRARTPSARQDHRLTLGCLGPTLFSAGRLVPIKGFDILVRAVSRLPPQRRPRIVIAGEGPERERLTQLATERRVSLDLLGTLPRAQVAEWMIAADLYVQPSRVLPSGRSEGMPVAVQEALAVGSPVVATSAGGLAELSGRIVLVSPGDPGMLAAAIDAQITALTAQTSTHVVGERCEVGDAHPPRHSM